MPFFKGNAYYLRYQTEKWCNGKNPFLLVPIGKHTTHSRKNNNMKLQKNCNFVFSVPNVESRIILPSLFTSLMQMTTCRLNNAWRMLGTHT